MDNNQRALTDEVARRYESWAYPEPISDLVEWGKNGLDFGEANRLHDLYWPHRDDWQDIDILIAGCGTNQAAIFAYRHPKARVVGIDVSNTSLEHEDYLKKKHNLSNLTLHHLSIEDAGSLNSDFDLIVSSGVIHHMKDPLEGVTNLGRLLRQDGSFNIMVYAKYGRTGVYMMQDLLRELGVGLTLNDVGFLKDTLEALPPYHFTRQYLGNAVDVGFDSGLVDTFLPRRDLAYTVGDCLDLVEQGGLEFQAWVDNYCYYPEPRVPSSHPLFDAISSLDEKAIWRAMELVWGTICTHSFLACRKDRPKETYAVDFDSPRIQDCIPVSNVNLRVAPADPEKKTATTLYRPLTEPLPLNSIQASLYANVDGKNSVRDCLRKSELQGDSKGLMELARRFFRDLWRMGHIYIKLPR